jgi:hypothetical protein
METIKTNKIIALAISVAVIILGILSFYSYKKVNIQTASDVGAGLNVEAVELGIIKTTDQQKLLAVAKNMSQDKSKTELEREAARLLDAKNASDLTSVGLSEDRHKNFVDSYVTLYNIHKNGKSEKNKAKAGLSFLYVYGQSCSVDDWLIEAASLFNKDMVLGSKTDKPEDKKVLSYKILSKILSEINYQDKAIAVALAETNMRLARLEKVSKQEMQNILLKNISNIKSLENSTSTLETSSFDMLDTERKILTMIMSAENNGIDTKLNIEQEYNDQIQKTEKAKPAEGAYVNEYNLRYLYASHLWSKGGKKNIEKIKEVLAVTLTEEKTKNAPGWIYGISVAEKNPFYQFLKPISKEYPELADFLKKHGWKTL